MKIDQRELTEDVIGFCGVFCGGCPSYHVRSCHGCRSTIENQKRVSKWKCKKRLCCIDRNIYSCGDCVDFIGCKIRKPLIKSYKAKYNLDLDQNARNITLIGPLKWLSNQIKQYKCEKCGGVISPYDGICIHCQNK